LIEAGRHLPFQEALGDNSPLIAFIFDYLSTTAPQFFFASQTEDLYPEDTTPYGEMLLFTMSFFPGLDQVASGIDFFRSLAAGDVAGAILSGLDFVTPGSVRAIGNALGYSEEALGIIGRNADDVPSGGARAPQDVNVNPQPPPARAVEGRVVGTSSNQANVLQEDNVILEGFITDDIRVNQQQISVEEVRVGVNRPDLQFTVTINGQRRRVYIEYERPGNPRGEDHANRIRTNDPNAIVIVRVVNENLTNEAGIIVNSYLYASSEDQILFHELLEALGVVN
jgi:hypothetical protein